MFRNPYLSLLRTAWHYARGQRKRYLAIYSLFTLSNLSMSAAPVIWGLFINELQKEGVQALHSTWIYVGVFLVFHLFDWLFHGPARIMERKLAFEVGRNFLHELYHKTVHLPVKWHQDNHSGATINRVRKAHEALFEFFDNGFMYFQTIAKLFFALAAMIYFSPIFGGIAVTLGIGVIYIILVFDKPFIAAATEVNEREHEVSATLFDSLSNIITVITLRLEKRMEVGLLGKISNILPPFRRKIVVNEWKWFTVDTAVNVIYAIIVLGYIYQTWVPGEVFLVGGLVTLVGYVNQFTSVFHNIAWQYTTIVRFHTDVQSARNIIEEFERQHLPDQSRSLPVHWQEMAIKGLYFEHKEAWRSEKGSQGLYNLNVRIARGEKIALIGESGSGKSTLLALLRGLYPAEKGQLFVDNEQAQKLEIIANYVTLFPQEPEIFENTIEYNITLGLPFEKEEVERICQVVHFQEVIKQLPNGLQSGIQEKGVNLSGGQKQRLALARGVLAAKDSDIVLLDEPTSSVDPKTELLIYEQMFEEFSDKAVVSSLHRLHLLTKFDYVYILDKGYVVDEGTFENLRKESPVFQELWKHQEESMLGIMHGA
ncbi:MAG: multidrug resistance-like ATP-binding protein MdlB [Saprospiraceae bacterium]|nr:MAG: multidrug resistance-like ATP-binding protein MdlB [Saprospiraceae bacterium]